MADGLQIIQVAAPGSGPKVLGYENTKTIQGTSQAAFVQGAVILDSLGDPIISATGFGTAGSTTQRVALATSLGVPTFSGRVQSFRTPGRAGTAGQKIFALHNATASTKIVRINQVAVDLVQLAAIASTVLPVIIRIHRFTAIPTGGTSLTKVTKDTSLTSSSSLTAWGDASADGTGSGTALAVTIPAGSMITQEFAARLVTAAGYEPFDRETFLEGAEVVLRALEGIVVFLDYTLVTSNPTTNHWIVGADLDEVTA